MVVAQKERGGSWRALAGKIGGLTLAATHDPREYTKAARARFVASFYDQTNPDLPEAERLRRAAAARRLYFVRLAAKSAKARAKKRRRP